MPHAHHTAMHTRHDEDSTSSLRRPSRDIDVEAQPLDVSSPSSRAANAHPHVHMVEPVSFLAVEGERHPAPTSPVSPKSRHRSDSANTRTSFKTLRKRRTDTYNIAYGAADMGRAVGWMPGAEPGLDTSDPAPPYTNPHLGDLDGLRPERLNQQCEITCVDYSEDDMAILNLDNDNLEEHLGKPKPDWCQVRWINVNGLSWDVIRLIGNYKGLHRLAIEDLMNTRSRTKADWYRDHTFIVLPLQKLVNLEDQDDSNGSDSEGELPRRETADDNDENDEHDDNADEPRVNVTYVDERTRRRREERRKKFHRGAVAALVRDIIRSRKSKKKLEKPARSTGQLTQSNSFKASSNVRPPWAPRQIRTLHQWHAGPNQDRTMFMERNSALSRKGLSVSMEQVSIFLCADGTVVSFFEYSAQDIEMPIVRRLQTPGTILRQACDASMLMQAILDGIVDLAIPVTTAYQDTLGDLELEVLTDPDIHESKLLYILTSEIATLRNAIAPVVQLMSALKDHKTEASNQMGTQARSISAVTTPPHEHVATMANFQMSRPTMPATTSTANRSYFNPPPPTVIISPLTVTYLSDAQDHALLIQDSYDQMRRSADNLVDLIFNTVSAFQNESMKQLTLVTCFFLPLSFMTGYFGMNFGDFKAVTDNSDQYFWKIAAPVCVGVLLLLLRESIFRWLSKVASKSLIARGRKRRLAKRNTKIE